MISVLHCLDSFKIGGTELNAVRQIECLPQDRVRNVVLSLAPDGPLRRRLLDRGVPVVDMGRDRRPSLSSRWRMTASVVRSHNIDIVHAHDAYTGASCLPGARLLTSAKCIASRRWWRPLGHHARAREWIGHMAAHRILANSQTIAAVLAEEEGVRQSRIAVIPNFLGDDAFLPSQESKGQTLRARLEMSGEAVVVMCVARLAAEKNLSLMLRSFAMARIRDHRLQLVLVGEGPMREPLEAEARRLSVAEHVWFPGWEPSVPSPYFSADIACLSSAREGFPNTVLEAMAAGIPVVCTAVGGVPDLVIDEVNGYLVRPDDPEAIANALCKLSADAGLRQSMGTASRALARARYHENQVIPLLLRLYEDIQK